MSDSEGEVPRSPGDRLAAVTESSDRQRSPSPQENQKKLKTKRKDAGFKWKEKRRDDDVVEQDQGLKRGYRDHYRPKERQRSRSMSPKRRDYEDRGSRRYDDRDRDRDNDRDYNSRYKDRDDRYSDRHRPEERDRNLKSRHDRDDRKERKERPEKKAAPVPAMPQQEMILVTVNDRLGSKKQIPCLPIDTIKDFKAVVAMMIGRRPHEILLKRQSERPFKDFLTLQDYGVSNGVQLDLEVDTGD